MSYLLRLGILFIYLCIYLQDVPKGIRWQITFQIDLSLTLIQNSVSSRKSKKKKKMY